MERGVIFRISVMYRYGLLILSVVCVSLACIQDYTPVCGTDGNTYSNECLLRAEARNDPSLKIASDGGCDGSRFKRNIEEIHETVDPNCICPFNYAPVCGSDGITYPNKCALDCKKGKKEDLEVKYPGECKEDRHQLQKVKDAPLKYAESADTSIPVCATNGVTYPSKWEADKAKAIVAHPGKCARKSRSVDSCVCTYEYKPVCGSDGKTYGNNCQLNCNKRQNPSLRAQHDGPCRLKRSSPLCPCTREYNPMCGSDGRTYNNACLFRCAAKSSNIHVKHPGPCGRGKRSLKEPLCACPKNLRPTCATNGKTYDNPCLLECAAKANDDIRFLHEGYCYDGKLQHKEPLCPCPKNLKEVCGSNGKTYANPCLLQCAAKSNSDITLAHIGPCN